ncbi:tyrosine-type recombinase/integrase [Phenylobacterium kunshanense]|uniref:Site-specific integrase n=1 Tax=Phenylobacterium kunshanense TaxID=1445034 RepID=A0A328BQI0_9CAUL|nr:tyrosine-type recombinase/integrase [Phenylobacterium kunshanense]RAK68761.1 site-specific integrase [Phenylobacterium kunshanense]
MVDLKGLYTVRAKGRVYHYAWRGGPRILAPYGTPAFAAEFAHHHADRKGGDKARLSGLCAMFRASDAWNGKGPRPISAKTRASWSTWLDRIQVEFGDLRVEQFDRPAMRPIIIKWRNRYAATPRAADMGIQVLSRLLSFGMEEGKLLNNICKGIGSIYDVDRSGLIWTADDLAELEKHAAPEIMRAARLAALTGLRQSDLLRLSWSHVQPHSIEIATGKSRKRKTTLIPLYDELRDYLASVPKKATTVLVNTKGRPWQSGFGSSWKGAKNNAPTLRALHFHDLRGTAATRFYLGGLSIREIAEIMTWSEDYVEGLIDRYVKKDELLRDRIRRINENAQRTSSEKPNAKRPPKC